MAFEHFVAIEFCIRSRDVIEIIDSMVSQVIIFIIEPVNCLSNALLGTVAK